MICGQIIPLCFSQSMGCPCILVIISVEVTFHSLSTFPNLYMLLSQYSSWSISVFRTHLLIQGSSKMSPCLLPGARNKVFSDLWYSQVCKILPAPRLRGRGRENSHQICLWGRTSLTLTIFYCQTPTGHHDHVSFQKGSCQVNWALCLGPILKSILFSLCKPYKSK